jgi:signal transduction histidine kinase
LAVVRDINEQVEAYQNLEQRVEERTRALVTLLEISQNVASSLDLGILLDQIIDQIQRVLEFTGASVFTFENETLVARAYSGPLPPEEVLQLRIHLPDSIVDQEIFRRREPVIISDVQGDDPLATALQRSLNPELMKEKYAHIRSWMGVPLIVKDRLIGNLVFDHETPGFYQDQHARLAQAFANQAAVAIENARLYEQALELASLQERQKLARELHDSVSQALYGIALGSRTAQTILNRTARSDVELHQKLSEPLDYIVDLAEAGLSEMRALIFELHPESLESEGLVAALTKQASVLQARHQMAVALDLDQEPDIPLDAKQALYRIAQEAMHNSVKHAHASRVLIGLKVKDELCLTVQDDGRGFDTSRAYPGHLGLRSMRERAERLGGHYEVVSASEAGTTVRVTIPLESPLAAKCLASGSSSNRHRG